MDSSPARPVRVATLLACLLVAALVGSAPAGAAPTVAATAPADAATVPADGGLAAYYSSTAGAGTVVFEVCTDAACGSVASRGRVSGVASGTVAEWHIDPPLPAGRTFYWRVHGVDSAASTPTATRAISTAPGDITLTGIARNSVAYAAVGTSGTILGRGVNASDPWIARTITGTTATTSNADWLAVTTFGAAGMVAVGRSGASAYSTNNGLAWSPGAPCGDPGEHLLDIAQLGSSLYAVGSNGLVCQSTDGAITWTSTRITGSADLVAVTSGPTKLYAVDATGVVWERISATTWTSHASGLTDASGAFALNDTTLTVISARGGLVSTSNSGGAFTAPSSPTGAGLFAIDAATNIPAPAPVRTWVVGKARAAYADGAANTFAPASTIGGPPTAFHDIEAGPDAGDAVVVGGNRTIYATSDAGVTWNLQYSPPVATAPPTASGTGALGSSVLGQPGTWTGHSLTFAYSWERCKTIASCTVIADANTTSYTVGAADANSSLLFVVRASNSAGEVVRRSAPLAAFTATGPTTTPPKENHAPSVPASPSPQSGMVLAVLPVYSATFTDPDGDRGILEFERCSDAACTSVLGRRTIGPIASGAVGQWRPTTSLATGLTVFWRVHAVDAAGLAGPATAVQSVATPPVLLGTTTSDELSGSDGDDAISSGAGNDTIDGAEGDDDLDGGSGNDVLRGCAGDDRMNGGVGNDSVDGCEGADRMNGDAGRDRMDGGAGDDTVSGDAGNDVVRGGAGNDTAAGGAGNDVLVGGTGTDRLDAGLGNDTVDSRERIVRGRGRSSGFATSFSLVDTALDLARAKAPRAVRDRITCGRGIDHVRADASDVVAADCEFVNGRRHKFR